MTHSCFRGFLSISVLKAISENQKTGYSLMKHLEKTVGAKPSAGSMYPLLENLASRDLITVKTLGRTKEYTITKEGKKQLALVEGKRDECLSNIIESMKLLSAITGEDMKFPLGMIASIKNGQLPFKEINPEWDTLRLTLFDRMQAGTLKKNAPKIKRLLAQAHEEIESL